MDEILHHLLKKGEKSSKLISVGSLIRSQGREFFSIISNRRGTAIRERRVGRHILECYYFWFSKTTFDILKFGDYWTQNRKFQWNLSKTEDLGASQRSAVFVTAGQPPQCWLPCNFKRLPSPQFWINSIEIFSFEFSNHQILIYQKWFLKTKNNKIYQKNENPV